MADWQTNNGLFTTNYVLLGDCFAVSYNPSPGGGIGFFISDDGGAETAIVHDGEYYILNGDFRAEYEPLVPQGIEACLAFYRSMAPACGSSWSTGEAA